ISRTGSGAPMASGFRKSRGLRMAPSCRRRPRAGATCTRGAGAAHLAPAVVQRHALALCVDVRLEGSHPGIVGLERRTPHGMLDAPVDHVAEQGHTAELDLELR